MINLSFVKIFAVAVTLIMAAQSAQAGAALCTVADPTSTASMWTQLKVVDLGQNSFSLTVVGIRKDVDPHELGFNAILKYVRTVHPNGQTFYNFRGIVAPGYYQKTISVFISEDGRTLTQMVQMQPFNYNCQQVN